MPRNLYLAFTPLSNKAAAVFVRGGSSQHLSCPIASSTSCAVVARARRKRQKKPQSMPSTANFKNGDWLALVSKLQGNYSRSLYGAEGLVEGRDLAIIWLPLLDQTALLLLTQMGVCAWEPAWTGAGASRSLLPLYAPHSTVDTGLAVWRHVAVEQGLALPSHAWVEVTHAPRSGEMTLPWFYAAPGSGVSLNLGRTVGVRLKSCLARPSELRSRGVAYRSAWLRSLGVDPNAGLDSLQLLDACDPKDSPEWRQKGFRHEVRARAH